MKKEFKRGLMTGIAAIALMFPLVMNGNASADVNPSVPQRQSRVTPNSAANENSGAIQSVNDLDNPGPSGSKVNVRSSRAVRKPRTKRNRRSARKTRRRIRRRRTRLSKSNQQNNPKTKVYYVAGNHVYTFYLTIPQKPASVTKKTFSKVAKRNYRKAKRLVATLKKTKNIQTKMKAERKLTKLELPIVNITY